MSQIIQDSIKELGTIKIVSLSEKKVRLDYTAKILCGSSIVVNELPLKIRYKINQEGVYQMYYPKTGFLNGLSNKLRVKKKFIHYGTLFTPTWSVQSFPNHTTQKSFELEGYDLKLNNLITSLWITDENWFKEWNRDRQLYELLK